MTSLKYLNKAVFMLKFSILYPIDKSNFWFKKCLYYLWGLLFLSSYFIIMVLCVDFVYKTEFNLAEEAMIIMNIVFYAGFFINVFIFFYNSTSLVNLITTINDGFVYETDNKIQTITMEKHVKMTDKMPIYWTISLFFGAMAPTLIALATGELYTPLLAWFPFEIKKSPMLEISFFLQCYCAFSLAIFYGATDCIYPCIVGVIRQQFRILGSNIKHGFYYSLLTAGFTKERIEEFTRSLQRCDDLWALSQDFADIFATITGERFKSTNLNYLNRNIKHHILLLRVCKEIDRIMSMFLLVKCGGQMFNIVLIAFSLITSGDSSLFLGLCTYIFFASFMLLIYNYSGQVLTDGTDILWKLYESPWCLCDFHYQKSFLLVQMKISQTVCTKAGHHFSLSAQTFIMFMRAAFSYIAVLKEIIDREK